MAGPRNRPTRPAELVGVGIYEDFEGAGIQTGRRLSREGGGLLLQRLATVAAVRDCGDGWLNIVAGRHSVDGRLWTRRHAIRPN